MSATVAARDAAAREKVEDSEDLTHLSTEDSVAMEKEPGALQRIWKKLDLNVGVVLMMMKGALPPTIILALTQSKTFVTEFTTLTYLTAIMSLISLPILPRAKFVQAMFVSVLTVCVGAAVALLQLQCVVSARQTTTKAPSANHTGASGSKESLQYNSSASVVACVWLFFTIYVATALKAKRPQLQITAVQYSIFTIITSTSAPGFPTMTVAIGFVERLIKVFLTGFAVGTGVSLFVLPVTSRVIVSKQMAGMLGMMKGALGAQGSYMRGVTNSHSLKAEVKDRIEHHDEELLEESRKKAKVKSTGIVARAEAVKQNMIGMTALYSKIKLEIGFAKKEVAFGKLRSDDYPAIASHLADILQPMIGMSTFIDIMQNLLDHEDRGHANLNSKETSKAIRRLEADEWEEIFTMSHEPFIKLRSALIDGMTHISYVLELEKKPKDAKKDVEETAAVDPVPGDSKFADYLEKEVKAFHEHRQGAVQRWCESKGVVLPHSFWNEAGGEYSWKDQQNLQETVRHQHNQQQLYLVLYIEYLLSATGKALLNMVRYADSKVEDGTMAKNRFIFPGWKRIRKLLEGSFTHQDSDQGLADGKNTGLSIWVGDSLKERKDPEHLPPSNTYEKVTNKMRAIPRFLGSEESAYAFRTAAASISIAILDYIRQTHNFFQDQRGTWALIMIAFSMSTNSGVGMFGFIAKISGTAIAAAAAIVIWYMGDQKPAAVVPLFYIFQVICYGVVMKAPSMMLAAFLSMATTILIIGYELQANQLARKIVESSGQPYYKIYILAPYRLAAVGAGIAIAFFWTYIPYPITAHSTLRKDLGSTLYLLGNYYSCVHTTVDTKLHLGADLTLANKSDKAAAMVRLDKARAVVFNKLIIMLDRLRGHSKMTQWEPRFGGKFPKATYDELISSMYRLMHYTSLIAYSANAFCAEDADESTWLRDFRRLVSDLNITSHEMTSTLCLVSASVTNSQPLPPYLRVPKPFALAEHMASIDPEILSIKHVNEPCYAAFAVLEVASSLVTEQVAQIVKRVRDLVGEVDFSFHVISTRADGTSTSSTLWGDSDENDHTYEDGKKGKNE